MTNLNTTERIDGFGPADTDVRTPDRWMANHHPLADGAACGWCEQGHPCCAVCRWRHIPADNPGLAVRTADGWVCPKCTDSNIARLA